MWRGCRLVERARAWDANGCKGWSCSWLGFSRKSFHLCQEECSFICELSLCECLDNIHRQAVAYLKQIRLTKQSAALKTYLLLDNLCSEPSQQLVIISGLRETLMKRYIVERTSKAEIRPKEQSEKADSCRENLGVKYSWKSHKDGNRHKNRIKRSGQARLVYVKDINPNIPTTWRWARRDNSKINCN